MPATSAGSESRTTKSAPWRMNAATGPGGPGRARCTSPGMLLPVRPGFCSEPDSANSRSMIFSVSRNQV
jgi:hypothetical protein